MNSMMAVMVYANRKIAFTKSQAMLIDISWAYFHLLKYLILQTALVGLVKLVNSEVDILNGDTSMSRIVRLHIQRRLI